MRWSYADNASVGLAPASGGWLIGSFYDFDSTDLSTFRGDETLSTDPYFCVDSTTGALFQDAAFMFDVSGIVDTDGPFMPVVTYYGTAADSTLAAPLQAELRAEYVGRPSVSVATGAATTRWYVIVAQPTTFHAGSTQLTFTVTRQQDGLPVAVIVDVPVQFRPNAASCG